MKAPRLSIGLPVYNGERYLAESIDALLGQSYEDFELIISDNASTDSTADICRGYEKQDSRVRYLRQRQNIGLIPNHNFVVQQSRGELFMWAASDDLYARDLVKHCVAALDEHPDVVLAHSWTATIDSLGNVSRAPAHRLSTDSPRAPERFRSVLFGGTGASDQYGVIRSDILRRVGRIGTYHHSDVTLVSRIALTGRFHHTPDWLYFRRDFPERAYLAHPTVRSRCVNNDPRRANGFLHPTARLLAEYVLGFITAIQNAPLEPAERRECYRYLAEFMLGRVTSKLPMRQSRNGDQPSDDGQSHAPPVREVVAGQQRMLS